MDAETRARYQKWKWQRIRRRVIFPVVILLFVWVVVMIFTISYEDANPNIEGDLANIESENKIVQLGEGVKESVETSMIEPVDLAVEVVEDGHQSDESTSRVWFMPPADHLETISNEEALSYLAFVNQNFRLSSEFVPEDLIVVNVQSVRGTHFGLHLLRATAAHAAEDLFRAAHDEGGHILVAASGFRSYLDQINAHHYMIGRYGEVEAQRVSARPGHSEHQLGLALDITTHALGGRLTPAFSTTPEGTWVRNHAHRFGFIIRYPQDREADTGFVYEPWHIRYVGIDVATEIFNEDLIFETYIFQ